MNENIKFVKSIFIYKDLNFLFYNESIFDINDLFLIDEISIIINIHFINEILFSYIQFIHIIIIFENIKKFLEFENCENY